MTQRTASLPMSGVYTSEERAAPGQKIAALRYRCSDGRNVRNNKGCYGVGGSRISNVVSDVAVIPRTVAAILCVFGSYAKRSYRRPASMMNRNSPWEPV